MSPETYTRKDYELARSRTTYGSTITICFVAGIVIGTIIAVSGNGLELGKGSTAWTVIMILVATVAAGILVAGNAAQARIRLLGSILIIGPVTFAIGPVAVLLMTSVLGLVVLAGIIALIWLFIRAATPGNRD